MAVQSRELRPERRWPLSMPSGYAGNLAYLITGILVLLASYVLLSSIVSRVRIAIDDVQYGRPRTYHLTAHVGRPEETGAPTHLIALNLDRQVMIIEIPGGDVNQVRTMPGPYLFGAGEDLTPVTMRLADINGDGVNDLIVRIKNEEMVYVNREQSFTLLTAEERQHLLQQQGGR
ncbi:hypothetical protein [Candidatus Chloroploca sp. Khr17]|uniref:hypothetical protein n=1 Tax=Candidatus Chloroploca sp. Khr17 TaxID=2496869 RepID=UPI00101DED4D|nr:hypothetical protein [Candidatus Chloroploca sp. Khr17]